MALSRVQSVGANGTSGSPSVTLASTANHSTLIFMLHSRGTGTFTAPTTQPNWKRINRVTTADGVLEMYYRNDAPAGITTITFTASDTTKKWAARAIEYSGAYVWDTPFGSYGDGNSSTSGTGTTAGASSSATTTDSGDYFVTCHGTEGSVTFSAPTNGFTLVSTDSSGGGGAGTRNSLGFCEKVPGATGQFYNQVTISTSSNWASIHATLKPMPTGRTLKVKAFSYMGDGTDQNAFTGLGFKPDILIIHGVNATSSNRIMSWPMLGSSSSGQDGLAMMPVGATGAIENLSDDGFTVGTTSSLNQAGVFYHGIAIQLDDARASIDYGQYVGDATDNRNITVGWQPECVWVKNKAASSPTYVKPASLAGDAAMPYDATLAAANLIQAFAATTFQVGTGLDGLNSVYDWLAMKQVTGGGEGGFRTTTYTGDGTDDRNITVEVGFAAAMHHVLNADHVYAAHFRFTSMADDRFGYYAAIAEASDGLQRNFADGLQVGTGDNASGDHYHIISLGATYIVLTDASPIPQLALLGAGV